MVIVVSGSAPLSDKILTSKSGDARPSRNVIRVFRLAQLVHARQSNLKLDKRDIQVRALSVALCSCKLEYLLCLADACDFMSISFLPEGIRQEEKTPPYTRKGQKLTQTGARSSWDKLSTHVFLPSTPDIFPSC